MVVVLRPYPVQLGHCIVLALTPLIAVVTSPSPTLVPPTVLGRRRGEEEDCTGRLVHPSPGRSSCSARLHSSVGVAAEGGRPCPAKMLGAAAVVREEGGNAGESALRGNPPGEGGGCG